VAILLALLMLLPKQWLTLLAYQRGNGHWWEFLSAGWIHFEFSHGVSSVIGLVVMWLLFAEHIKPIPVWMMLISAASLSVLFEHWLALPPYVSTTVVENKGFSGALYGFFAWGATLDIIKRRPFGAILLLLVVGKVALEAFLGEPLLTFSEVERVAVMGHLGGAIAGIFCALIYYFSVLRLTDKS
jgi:rhomboid family GlyGly-CTERM serine protease